MNSPATPAKRDRLAHAQTSARELLDSTELRAYSLQKVLQYLADPKAHARSAGLELGISSRARQLGVAPDREGEGVFVPFAALARDLVQGTPTAGGNIVASEVHRGRVISLLRAASKVVDAGAQVFTDLVGNVSIPRQVGGPAIEWVAENAAPNESGLTWDQVMMSPKTAAGFVDVSRRLMLQTGSDVSRLVAQDLVTAASTAIDQAAIIGTGTGNQPRGILNTAGVGSVPGGADGAAPTWSHLVDLEASVAHQNTVLERPGFLTNTRVRAKLEKTEVFAGGGVPVWAAVESGDRLKGRPAYVSNAVPNTLTKGSSVGVCSAIIFGNWSDMIIGLWGPGITVLADPITKATDGGLRLVVHVDCDIATRYVTSFATMQDVLTA